MNIAHNNKNTYFTDYYFECCLLFAFALTYRLAYYFNCLCFFFFFKLTSFLKLLFVNALLKLTC